MQSLAPSRPTLLMSIEGPKALHTDALGPSATHNVGRDPSSLQIPTFEWDLDGDGSADVTEQAFESSVPHVFGSPGEYPATVMATDPFGRVDTHSFVVTVHAPPTADFTHTSCDADPAPDDDTPCTPVGASVAFDPAPSLSTAVDLATSEWDFGNGSTRRVTDPADQVVETRYRAAGDAEVALRVQDRFGQWSDVLTKTIGIAERQPGAGGGGGSAPGGGGGGGVIGAPEDAPPVEGVTPPVERLQGADRYGTAVALSQGSFAAGVPVVYLTTGSQFADALAAGPVASGAGPILLVERDAIPTVVGAELTRLVPGRIVVLGGTTAVSDAVREAARAFTSGTVTRVAGADRYETAAKLSAESQEPGVAVAYVASGVGFADALAAGPVAANGGPILLVRPDVIPAATAGEMARLEPGRIVVLGGPAAVSDDVLAALGEFTTGEVTRLSGADRYATAVAISRSIFEPGVEAVFLATGAGFADALAAGSASGGVIPILLTRPDCVPQVVLDEIDRLDPGEVRVLGGPSAVSASASALTSCGPVP